MLNEWLRLFERAGWVYEQRLSSPQWKKYPTESIYADRRTEACLNALLLFLEGYAFERFGGADYFSGLAVDVLNGIGTWPPDEQLVWKRFKYALSRWKQDSPEVVRWTKSEAEIKDLPSDMKGLNTKVNPLAPKRTDYFQKDIRAGSTSQKSIVQLALDSEIPLDIWVRDSLERRDTKNIFGTLGCLGNW
jgi:hypothetical protein